MVSLPWGNTNRVVSNRVVSKGPLYPSKTKFITFFPVYMPLKTPEAWQTCAVMCMVTAQGLSRTAYCKNIILF